MIYLTGTTNETVEDLSAAAWGELGLLIQPGNSYHLRVDRFAFWAADNGCFSSKGFSEAGWWSWLEGLVGTMAGLDWTRHEIEGAGEPVGPAEMCLFATAPDVVGDAAATLERSLPWLARIQALGLPAAFVAQDGSEDLGADLIPWGAFDVLFLGGSTEWKLDPERAGRVTGEAHRRGIPVHMGRVNSARRFALAASWDVETADGTFLAFGTKANLPRLAGWLDDQRGNPALALELADAAAEAELFEAAGLTLPKPRRRRRGRSGLGSLELDALRARALEDDEPAPALRGSHGREAGTVTPGDYAPAPELSGLVAARDGARAVALEAGGRGPPLPGQSKPLAVHLST